MLTWLEICLALIVLSITSLLIETPFPHDSNESLNPSKQANRARDSAALDTTLVLLNWSRFENVKNITSTICERLLEDTIHSIIVWNNNPKPLFFSDFTDSTCPKAALTIINSPENRYFEARYLACTQAQTPYCFIQDDDYLVRPEIIQALAIRMRERSPGAIHLQPPDEMLSSQLRTVSIGSRVHTTFAWLGYGTIIQRSSTIDFLNLIDKLQLSDEEHKMADNYFTILSNDVPERWFDPGVPLGGGQPFTVGTEGEERNNRHIIRAAQYLEQITSGKPHPQALPYVRFPLERKGRETDNVSRAPCQGRLCLFETSIGFLPERIYTENVSAVMEILEVEKERLRHLGESGKSDYLRFSPSNAVDGKDKTDFRSPGAAQAGDWIMLDLLRPVLFLDTSFALLVGQETEAILLSAIFETSRDGETWDGVEARPNFTDLRFESGTHGRLCRINVEGVVRFLRARLLKSFQERWVIHEIYVESYEEVQLVIEKN